MSEAAVAAPVPTPAAPAKPATRTEFCKSYFKEHGSLVKPTTVVEAYKAAGGTENLTNAYVSQLKLKYFNEQVTQPTVKKAKKRKKATAKTAPAAAPATNGIHPPALDAAFDSLIRDCESLGEVAHANAMRFIRAKVIAKASDKASWKPLA